MSWYVYLIGIIVLIALSAFCSGSEMAYSSANRMRLENLMEDGSTSRLQRIRLLSCRSPQAASLRAM